MASWPCPSGTVADPAGPSTPGPGRGTRHLAGRARGGHGRSLLAAASTLEPADVATLDKDRGILIPTGVLALPEPVIVENRGGSLSTASNEQHAALSEEHRSLRSPPIRLSWRTRSSSRTGSARRSEEAAAAYTPPRPRSSPAGAATGCRGGSTGPGAGAEGAPGPRRRTSRAGTAGQSPRQPAPPQYGHGCRAPPGRRRGGSVRARAGGA